MAAKKRYLFRYLIIAVLFCAVNVVYLGRLFFVQISGRDEAGDDGTTSRIVTVQAMRGEIYDRNGEKLVANRYLYDLTVSYAAVASVSPEKANRTYLQLLSSLDRLGESSAHRESYFPFAGAYPVYEITPEAQDPDSAVSYRMERLIKEKGLKNKDPVKEIVAYYVNTYGLLSKDESGHRLFNDNEVDRLLRLHYDMDAMRFNASNDYTLAKNVSLSLMTYVKELGKLPGVTFTVTAERVYLYPGYASHILGTVGPIYSEEWAYYNEQGYQMNAIVGKSGCELAFESYLRGSDGAMKITEDAAGNVVNVEVLQAPVAGNDVFLTIDIDIQTAAEDGLGETVLYVSEHDVDAVPGYECNAGAAVVMDPDTFDVLAIASYPSYDLTTYNLTYNDLLANPANPLLNRALQGTYAPGSTFKPGVAVAALMESVITPYTTFPCNGEYSNASYNAVYPKDHPKCSTVEQHGIGNLTVSQAIAYSCNCFFYETGYRLGLDRLGTYMKSFGIGQATGIELGESLGALAGPDYRHAEYLDSEVLRAAIGQSDTLVTPLQLCCYTAALTNHGTRYPAHLLDRVGVFGSDELLYSDDILLSSPSGEIAVSETAYQTVMKGMSDMIQSTAFARARLTVLGLDSVNGKTGTAEVTKSEINPETGERESFNITNALFICNASLGERRVAISVVAEQAAHGYFGAIAAQRILTAWKASVS